MLYCLRGTLAVALKNHQCLGWKSLPEAALKPNDSKTAFDCRHSLVMNYVARFGGRFNMAN